MWQEVKKYVVVIEGTVSSGIADILYNVYTYIYLQALTNSNFSEFLQLKLIWVS